MTNNSNKYLLFNAQLYNYWKLVVLVSHFILSLLTKKIYRIPSYDWRVHSLNISASTVVMMPTHVQYDFFFLKRKTPWLAVAHQTRNVVEVKVIAETGTHWPSFRYRNYQLPNSYFNSRNDSALHSRQYEIYFIFSHGPLLFLIH